jgi:methylenetetrahydrofolate reductase (NADPH)
VSQLHGFIAGLRVKIPEQLLTAFESRRDDPQAVLELGVAWSTLQCAELLGAGAPGIHFYTMNRSPATRAILSALLAARPWEHAR